MLRRTPLKRGTKPLRRVAKKIPLQEKPPSKMWEFFQQLWEKLPKKKTCWSCGCVIYGENSSLYWDHLLEKGLERYKHLAFEEKNMFFCCGECHQKKTNGFPTEKHQEAIDNAKQKL